MSPLDEALPNRGWVATSLALLVAIAGCSDAGATRATDAATRPDVAPDPDSGPEVDPTAVRWRRAAEPSVGPLAVWAFITAAIDEHRTVVFGGTNASSVSGVTLDDTWLYDASSGELVVTQIASEGPAPRYCGCAGWDPDRGRVLLTGGRDLSAPLSVPPETWELDLEARTWAQVVVPDSPPGVIGCMMAWSGARRSLYLFGGTSGAGPDGVTYRYDPTAPRWVALDVSGPPPRYDGVLTPLSDDELLLFGGSHSASGAAFYSDVWRFDTADEQWSEVVVEGEVPPGRRVPWLKTTDDRSFVYVAMGFDGAMEPIGDFWLLDLSATRWSQLTLPAELTARAFTHHLPAPGDAIGTMLGGYDGAFPVREAWELTVAE